MESIDERIQKASSSEDQAFLARMDADGSIYQGIAATFRGHMRWLNARGVGTILSFLGLGLIKLWFWTELQKETIVRDIKRVELQLASLTAALRASKAP